MKTDDFSRTGVGFCESYFAETLPPLATSPCVASLEADKTTSGPATGAMHINTVSSDTVYSGSAEQKFRQSGDPYGLQLRSKKPQTILVINCGSSSLKYCVYDTADASRNARGRVERIGIKGTQLVHQGSQGKVKRDLFTGGFTEAFKAMMTELTAKETGTIREPGEVDIVTHRVVHGGEKFIEGTLITDEILEQIEALNALAPLHNPMNVAGIREMRRLFPTAHHVAVFDTAFHHTLPSHAYLYGLPYDFYENKGVRRYGFHGTSHQYVSLRAAEFLNRRLDELRIVSCHLGNGSSLCAIRDGNSVDTSMGFTPAEGLIMGTRCGDIDAGVLAFLERSEGLSASQSEELLNTKSGLLGLSGISSDMREILRAAKEGDSRAALALEAYCYRARKYIGAYAAAMNGLDVVIFTGGIGEGSAEVRSLILRGLEFMGICQDADRNRQAEGKTSRISMDDSQVAVLVIGTDEERMMAYEALRCLKGVKTKTNTRTPPITGVAMPSEQFGREE